MLGSTAAAPAALKLPFMAGRSHYQEKHRVSCPGNFPKRSPCNIHTATTLRLAASRCKPTSLCANGKATWQHSCSQFTPSQIPNHIVTGHTHTQSHPKQLLATVTLGKQEKVREIGTYPLHTRGTFHRRMQPLHPKKHKVSFIHSFIHLFIHLISFIHSFDFIHSFI